jgi:hypothetical protein
MAAESGQAVPDLETRVNPAPHLLFHWAAFADLSTDRQTGFGRGQIPGSAIRAYALWYGIDDADEFERFRGLIRGMDRAFLEWHAEREK